MIQIEFQKGSGVVIGTDCYRFAERIRDRHRTPMFRHVTTEEPRTISDRELVDMLGRSEIQILTPGEMAEVEETGEPPKGPNFITLDDITSDWERARVRKYEPYLQGWVRAGCPPLSDRRLGPVIAQVADEQGDSTPPHPRTLRGFIQKWNARGRTLDGLVSGKARCGTRSQLTHTEREVILDVIWNEYLTLQRSSASDCYETLKRKIREENHRQAPGASRIRLPSLAQFRREIGKIDKFTVMASREGPRAAMMKFGPRYKGVDALHHNCRWEVDSTIVDLMLIDPGTNEAIGRPTITVVIDCYTRVVVGFYVGWESESYMTFVAAMGNALQSKSFIKDQYASIQHDWEAVGTPVYVAVDNHSAYIGEDCKNALKALGIGIQYTPVLKAWWRPIIERFFNTLTHKLFQRVPGTTFSNIFERNKETPPESIAVATLDELRELLTRWIVDEYHYTIHRGIRQPPAMLFEESTRQTRTVPPPSQARMRLAFSKLEERTPQHYGIEVETMIFNSPEVANEIIEPGKPNRRRIAIDYQNLDSIGLFSEVQGRWIQIERRTPAITPGHVLTWAEFTLERELKKARVKAYIEAHGGDVPKDLVAQWVREKSTSQSMTDRRRGERYKFRDRPQRHGRTQPITDAAGSSQPVSDSLFGNPAEQLAPPIPLEGASDMTAEPPRTAGRARPGDFPARSNLAAVPSPAAPEPSGGSEGLTITPLDGADLKAVAARLGISTHRQD